MSRSAKRYSKALLDLANQNQNLDKVSADMLFIEETLEQSAELRQFLSSPIIKQEIKLMAIKEVFLNMQKETLGLFDLLAANKRFDILSKITSEFQTLHNHQKGIIKGLLITAFGIDAQLESLVLAKAKTMTPFQVKLEHKIDPSIIGGFILRIGDQQLNASVAHKLQTLKRELI